MPRKSKRKATAEAPGLTLLSKLGSIIVHFDEGTSLNGHPVDIEAAHALLQHGDVQAWMKEMGPLLPVKRAARRGKGRGAK